MALSRVLGVHEYGIYVYVLAIVTSLSIVSRLGFDSALLRYIPVYRLSRDWTRLRALLVRSFQLTLAASLILSIAMASYFLLLDDGAQEVSPIFIALGFALLPALTLTILVQAGLRGLQIVPLNEFPDRVLRPLLMLAVICFAAFVLGRGIDAEDAISIHLAALVIALGVAAVLLNRVWPGEARGALTGADASTREWLITALPLAVFSISHVALSQIDILMVGYIKGVDEAGIYAVSTRLAVLAIFALSAVNVIFAPVISELHAGGRKEELQFLVTRAAQVSSGFAVMAMLGLGLLGEWVLSWFGPAFTAAYTSLIILCASHVFNAMTGSVGFLLAMSGEERITAYVILSALALNIVLNVLLIPPYGIEGAAVATAVATIFWNLVMFIYTRKRLGIDASALPHRQ